MIKFYKGYKNDVGIDIVLDEDIIFKPFETKVIDIKTGIKTRKKISVMLCARTSAAKLGLIVNQCPIDPGYTGNIHIIAHNCSNNILSFPAGKAFAQLYAFRFSKPGVKYLIKNNFDRKDKNFGSSDVNFNRRQ